MAQECRRNGNNQHFLGPISKCTFFSPASVSSPPPRWPGFEDLCQYLHGPLQLQVPVVDLSTELEEPCPPIQGHLMSMPPVFSGPGFLHFLRQDPGPFCSKPHRKGNNGAGDIQERSRWGSNSIDRRQDLPAKA